MDLDAIKTSYRRWAPVYDSTFGRITRMGRDRAVQAVNGRQGRVLEVGVGTGLSLSSYAQHLQVTGIDYSDDMLKRARKRVTEEGLAHVHELRQMDARTLDFPDGHFDTVVAMYLVSVVPEPERVMAEIARGAVRDGLTVATAYRAYHMAREGELPAALARAMLGA